LRSLWGRLGGQAFPQPRKKGIPIFGRCNDALHLRWHVPSHILATEAGLGGQRPRQVRVVLRKRNAYLLCHVLSAGLVLHRRPAYRLDNGARDGHERDRWGGFPHLSHRGHEGFLCPLDWHKV